jgi:hypothetical protein
MSTPQQTVRLCLVGLALALLLVGVVSGTILRHVVQIAPIVLALALARRSPGRAAYAAIPLFVFWTMIVVLIWLFLFGVSTIANGRYTRTEVGATVAMVAFAAAGVPASLRLGQSLRPLSRVVTVAVFAVFQMVAMWISFVRPIATH